MNSYCKRNSNLQLLEPNSVAHPIQRVERDICVLLVCDLFSIHAKLLGFRMLYYVQCTTISFNKDTKYDHEILNTSLHYKKKNSMRMADQRCNLDTQMAILHAL